MSVTFTAEASASDYYEWRSYIESDGVVSEETLESKSGITRRTAVKKLTGLAPGETYVAFYISSSEEYTRVFGFTVTVDAGLRLSISESVSDGDAEGL